MPVSVANVKVLLNADAREPTPGPVSQTYLTPVCEGFPSLSFEIVPLGLQGRIQFCQEHVILIHFFICIKTTLEPKGRIRGEAGNPG